MDALQRVTARALCLALIAIGIVTRLYHVGGPPLDHHWVRQYDTAAIARNFAEPGASIFYPKVDWGGDTPGYAQTEFPLYQYVVGTLYRVFGPHEAIARGVNILLYAVSCWILFNLGIRLSGERVGLLAAAFLSFTPLSWFFTRTIQPDATVLLGSLVAVLCFWRWTEEGSWWDFAASVAGLTIAALIKPPTLCLGLPLLYLSLRRLGWACLRQPALWAMAVVVFGSVAAWLMHAESLWERYGNTLYAFYSFPDFPKHPLGFFVRIFESFVQVVTTPLLVVFVIFGAMVRQPGGNSLALWWAAATLLPAVLIAEQFSGHDYYLLPAVLPSALLFGHGIDHLLRQQVVRKRVVVALCVAALPLSIWRVLSWFPDEQWHRDRVAFGKVIRSATEPGDRLIAVTIAPHRPGWHQHRMSDGRYLDHDAVDLYLSDRSGWNVGVQRLTPKLLEDLRKRGATHLFYFLNPDFPLLLARHPPIRRYLLARYAELDVGAGGALYSLAPRD